MGTPKTLQEAIQRALDIAGGTGLVGAELNAEILKHVRDFISQKFTTAMCDDRITLMQLWKLIIENESKE